MTVSQGSRKRKMISESGPLKRLKKYRYQNEELVPLEKGRGCTALEKKGGALGRKRCATGGKEGTNHSRRERKTRRSLYSVKGGGLSDSRSALGGRKKKLCRSREKSADILEGEAPRPRRPRRNRSAGTRKRKKSTASGKDQGLVQRVELLPRDGCSIVD